VESQVQKLARAARPRRRAGQAIGLGALLFAGVATAGLAGTQAGRDLVRWLVLPVHQAEHLQISLPPDPSQPNEQSTVMVTRMSSGGDAKPFTPQEKAAYEAEMAEIVQIKQAGGGRLVGLMEVPPPNGTTKPLTIFNIEYTLSNGQKSGMSGAPSPQQRANLRIDEILALRNNGGGQIVSSKPSELGLGRYTIRFTLADNTAVDLETQFPPGTSAERAAIFAEISQLKAARSFSVTQAVSGPNGKVWGILHYTLADGRQVGFTDEVPADMVGPDGRSVLTTEVQPHPQPGR